MPNLPPVFPPIGGAGLTDLSDADQAYYLALFDRLFPENYLAPMQNAPNSGYEVFQAYAALGERLSLAVQRLQSNGYIFYSAAGSRATGSVTLRRPDATAGAITVLAGSLVSCSKGGQIFQLWRDYEFGALDTELSVSVLAIADGYEWNVRGQRTAANGEVLAGEVDTIKKLLTVPAFGDPSIYVTQESDMEGGTAAVLSGLGADRGLTRRPGETADAFRLRVHTLPDTVSPGAIRRNVEAVLAHWRISYQFIETGDIRYQTCWDAPSPNIGVPGYQPVAPLNPNYDSTLFVYDDPRDDEDPYRNRWLDEVEQRGAFIIVLPRTTLIDLGLAYDDPGTVYTDFRDPVTGFGRGTPAYDIPNTASTALVYTAAYDGFDFGRNAMSSALWQTLQEIKAGGVAAILVLQED